MVNLATGRISYIDELKGLSIILVVFGHIVDHVQEAKTLYHFIYSFHMPLFMFLAGCTTVISFRRKKITDLQYIKKKFESIIIPYFAWSFLLPILFVRPISTIGWENIIQKTFVTNRMFWFLPTLFGLIFVYVCYHKLGLVLRKKCNLWENNDLREISLDVVACGIVVALVILLMMITKYQLFRDMVGFAIPFFAAVFYMEHGWFQKLLYHWWTTLVAFIVFVLLIGKFNFDNTSITTSLLRMVLGMCATILLLQIFTKASFPMEIKKQLSFFGQHTLLTYILHEQLMKVTGVLSITFENKTTNLFWYSLVSVLICFLCSIIALVLGHIPVVQTVLLGKRRI